MNLHPLTHKRSQGGTVSVVIRIQAGWLRYEDLILSSSRR